MAFSVKGKHSYNSTKMLVVGFTHFVVVVVVCCLGSHLKIFRRAPDYNYYNLVEMH